MKKIVTIITTLSLMMFSCAKEDMHASYIDSNQVEFTASAQISTRSVEKSAWEGSEAVGIYMMDGSSSLIRTNVEYSSVVNQSNTSFSPVDSEAITFPDEDKDMSFFAYYPYDGELSSEVVEIEITSKADLIVSDIVVGNKADETDIKFTFSHALSLIEIELEASNLIELTEDMKVYIVDSYTAGSYNLIKQELSTQTDTYSSVNFEITQSSSSGNYVASAILMPYDYDTANRDLTLYLEQGENSYKQTISPTWKQGYKYSYSSQVGEDGIIFMGSYIEAWDTTPKEATSSGTDANQDGTAEYPWLISTAAELAQMTNTTQYTTSSYYKLTADIDLSNTEWSSLCTNDSNSFTGGLDGDGYSIKGLNAPLFIYNNGVIKHLKIVDCDIDITTYITGVGTIASVNNGSGRILNCTTSGSVSGTVTTSMISNGFYFGVGGIVGYNLGYVAGSISSTNVYVSESANKDEAICAAGGLLGLHAASGQGCYSSFAMGSVTGSTNSLTGGIVGYRSSLSAPIENCYYASDIDDNCTPAHYGGAATTMAKIADEAFIVALNDGAAIYNETTDDETKKVCAWKVGPALPAYSYDTAPVGTEYADTPSLNNGYYEIYTVEQLKTLCNRTSTTTSAYKLMRDLNLGGYDVYSYNKNMTDYDGTGALNWSPIVYFSGTFEGNGYSISGLYCKSFRSDDNEISLFGYTNGVIRNLRIVGCHLVSSNTATDALNRTYMGGIAAKVSGAGSQIINCSVSGYIAGTVAYIGGISGYLANSTIVGCSNFAELASLNSSYSSYFSKGGIVGEYSSYTATSGQSNIEYLAYIIGCYDKNSSYTCSYYGKAPTIEKVVGCYKSTSLSADQLVQAINNTLYDYNQGIVDDDYVNDDYKQNTAYGWKVMGTKYASSNYKTVPTYTSAE